jgi:hypothetical protein
VPDALIDPGTVHPDEHLVVTDRGVSISLRSRNRVTRTCLGHADRVGFRCFN